MHEDDLLYHYTDAAGLLGIMGTPSTPPSIWMSQIQYMNDAEDWYHAYSLARQEILASQSRPNGIWTAALGLFGINHDGKRILGVTDLRESAATYRYFTFSLSEKGDLLSQWRGYAKAGGYSIGFRVADIRKMAADSGFELHKCIYSDDDKKAVVRAGRCPVRC